MDVPSVRLCAGTLLVEHPAEVLRDYVDPRNGYAYPGYDQLVTNGSATLVDGDLLAPTLIGAEIDRGRFALLRDLLPELAGVADLPPVALQDADDATVAAVADLFAVLDRAPYAGRGVRGTILSKVLHRKRPDLVPLYDSRIFESYTAPGALPREQDRTWQEFMDLLLRAMRDDLQHEDAAFDQLVGVAAGRRCAAVPAADPRHPHLADGRLLALSSGAPAGVPDESGHSGPVTSPDPAPAPLRERTRHDLAAGLLTVVALVLLGAPVGLLWARLAPRVDVVVRPQGAGLAMPETGDFISADGLFLVLAVRRGHPVRHRGVGAGPPGRPRPRGGARAGPRRAARRLRRLAHRVPGRPRRLRGRARGHQHPRHPAGQHPAPGDRGAGRLAGRGPGRLRRADLRRPPRRPAALTPPVLRTGRRSDRRRSEDRPPQRGPTAAARTDRRRTDRRSERRRSAPRR